MAYIPPSKRNKNIDKKEEVGTDDASGIVQTKTSVIVCKWCHQSDHLSIACKFKGNIQEKKPELNSIESFPSLNNVEVNNESIWNTEFKLDKFKEQVSKLSNNDMKRIGSSAVSLDTLTSNYSELEIDEIDNIIYQNDNRLVDFHPYKSYYEFVSKKNDDLYTSEFNQYWYIYLDMVN